MAENDKLHIRLHIYDTDMPVNVERSDEHLYRDAATNINEVINSYAAVFKGKKSDKEILYMALIDIALSLERQMERNDTKPYTDTLAQITSEIEDVLGV